MLPVVGPRPAATPPRRGATASPSRGPQVSGNLIKRYIRTTRSTGTKFLKPGFPSEARANARSVVFRTASHLAVRVSKVMRVVVSGRLRATATLTVLARH